MSNVIPFRRKPDPPKPDLLKRLERVLNALRDPTTKQEGK